MSTARSDFPQTGPQRDIWVVPVSVFLAGNVLWARGACPSDVAQIRQPLLGRLVESDVVVSAHASVL